MKIVWPSLVLVLVCAAQETPAEIDPSKVRGDWRTIYLAADNKEKIVEGGPLRCLYRQIECINGCEYLSLTFYVKLEGTCQLFHEVAKRQEGDVYIIEFAGTNVLRLIHVSDHMLVTYIENYDGEKITRITKGVAKGDSYTQEEFQKYQELNSERGIPNENIENAVETDCSPLVSPGGNSMQSHRDTHRGTSVKRVL
ncbi:hypothetical protein FD755_015841 [Muntiacus reevesi]|uniref:Lipocalin/cytosolic fatty-acid binding domain-containing protein n=1 Tax=Muntiacus reevesi TaxID=9886 RepID=A0A5N3XD72_MUNRE|nr:hypothetical protein FD755_015841 [Muntiacus reevesi]